ncbi:MAG: hypothetical protein V4683_09260 [Bacteroidota bacterium]
MEILFIIFIALHGFFHLLAFMKSFNMVTINQLKVDINKAFGVGFLIAFTFFAFLIMMYAYKSTNWWVYGIFGAVISQVLVIKYWKEAKYGTIPNLIILWICVLAFAEHYLIT